MVWVIFGALAGCIASLVVNATERQEITANVIVGSIGAFLGGWFMQTIGQGGGVNVFSLHSVFVAVMGAVVLLTLYHMFAGRKRI